MLSYLWLMAWQLLSQQLAQFLLLLQLQLLLAWLLQLLWLLWQFQLLREHQPNLITPTTFELQLHQQLSTRQQQLILLLLSHQLLAKLLSQFLPKLTRKTPSLHPHLLVSLQPNLRRLLYPQVLTRLRLKLLSYRQQHHLYPFPLELYQSMLWQLHFKY